MTDEKTPEDNVIAFNSASKTEAKADAKDAAEEPPAAEKPDVDIEAGVQALMDGVTGFFGGLKSIIEEHKDEFVVVAKAGKLSMSRSALEKDRDKALVELGKLALEHLQNTPDLNPELQKAMAHVNDVDAKITLINDELALLEPEPTETPENKDDSTTEEPERE